jgi:hypothetical protein
MNAKMRFSGILYLFKKIVVCVFLMTAVLYASDALNPDVPNYTFIVDTWKQQDSIDTKGYRAAITNIITGLPLEKRQKLQTELAAISGSDSQTTQLEQLYLTAATARRIQLFANLLPDSTRIIYTTHGVWSPIYYDNANEIGGDLVLVTMSGSAGVSTVLVKGQARDPDISFDGNRVLYAYRDPGNGKKSYHLYEMDLKSLVSRQITSGDMAPDYRYNSDVDGIYLPNDDIMFCSTRMIQMGDCLDDRSVTANLFLCNKDGKYLRRISYDQAHICYPSVLPSGQVIYSRWDYNDKNHTYAHGLFTVNPDGTKQAEYYGNNSWWPTALYYPRPIPGSDKIMAIIGGYHSGQAGLVGIVDHNSGIANGAGITLLAPVRLPKDDTEGNWAKDINNRSFTEYFVKWGPFAFDPTLFPKPDSYPIDEWTTGPYVWPCPLDENNMLVCKSDGLYFMTSSGHKELICSGYCSSPRLVTPRTRPPTLQNGTNWSKSEGVCQVMDIYISQSPVLKDIPRGTIKKLRVVALEYRTGPSSGHGAMNVGPGSVNNGGATTPIPIATVGACWDVKKIIGETVVESDGSASFYVPARTPVYFQALDEKGHVVQSMRSWATLMPGENNSCMGCHESKLNAVPSLTYTPIAIKRGPVPLDSFYGPIRGFSFLKEIQPILDAKCVSCHNTETPDKIDLSRGILELPVGPIVWGAVSGRTSARAYQNLVATTDWDFRGKYVWWPSAEDSPLLQPPYRTGSSRSPLIKMLESGHHDVVLTKEEHDKLCAWIDLGVPSSGDYKEGLSDDWGNLMAAREVQRRSWEAEEKKNIDEYVNDFKTGAVQYASSGMQNADKVVMRMKYNSIIDVASLQFSFSDSKYCQSGGQWNLTLYTCAGRYIGTVAEGELSPGKQQIIVNFNNFRNHRLALGTYICKFRAPGVEKAIRIARVR